MGNQPTKREKTKVPKGSPSPFYTTKLIGR